MKKILIIAYTFPPIPYGGSFRALRLTQGFVEKGIECHVLTIKEYSDIPNDYSLLGKVPSEVNIHRTTMVDPWRKYQGIRKKYSGKPGFNLIDRVISLLLRFITFPDHMLLWVPFSYFKARQIIKENSIDSIIVSSPPHSSLIIGWLLKKTINTKWIADLRDPIYGNVAQVHLINPNSIFDKLEASLLQKFDKFIVNSADVTVANTKHHSDELKQIHPDKNITFIRNSYDPEDYQGVETINHEEYIISHVGSIYGKRNPEILFSSIRRLLDANKEETLKIKLLFVGMTNINLVNSIKKYSLEEYVKIQEMVPHSEAIRTMCNSNLLLLIKATGPWSRGQIPGKFFEYVGTGNPILCLCSDDSEVADIIKENELGYVISEDTEKLDEILMNEYEKLKNSSQGLVKRDPLVIDNFSKKEMVNKMFKVVWPD